MDLLYFLADHRNAFLDFLQTIGKNMGSETVLLPIIALLYWCINKQWTYQIGFSFFSSGLVAQSLKITFRVPRPWVLDPSFKALDDAIPTATGYSFPSGHSQTAASCYGSMMAIAKKWWLKVLFILAFCFVGFTRMYAGVHTPYDVGTAFAVSLLTVFIIDQMGKKRKDKAKPYLPLAVIIAVFSVLCLIYGCVMYYGVELVTYDNVRDICKSAGGALAFAIAYFLDEKVINYDIKCSHLRKVIRTAIGIAVLLGLELGLKPIFNPLELVGDFLRYLIMVSFVLIFYPLLFTWVERRFINK